MNDYHLSKNDFIRLRNEIDNQDLSKIKSLSQKERKTLQVAIENFQSGKDAVIPRKIANKLTEPSTHEKSILKSIGKAIDKFFSKKYIDSSQLSQTVKDLPLSDHDSEFKFEDIDFTLESFKADIENYEKSEPEDFGTALEKLKKDIEILHGKSSENESELEDFDIALKRLKEEIENLHGNQGEHDIER